MERLYATYKDKVEFVIVYIREAHPEMLRRGNATGVESRPKNINERVILASACVTKFKFTIPMVIDGMEGTVNKDYQAAPVRVTITDKEGKTAYYAGRGPFDFRLSKVEKVLKTLVAHNGFMPPAPEVEWGEVKDGIRCGLSFNPPVLTKGDEVSVLLKFKNESKDPIILLVDTNQALENLKITNQDEERLLICAVEDDNRLSRMMRFRKRPQRVQPGEICEKEIDGKVKAAPSSGNYKGILNFTCDYKSPRYPIWNGEVQSGAFELKVSQTRKTTCFDCHGQENYHHESEKNCSLCHVGEADTDSFDMNHKGCSRCHPRKGKMGRRSIIRPGGEFLMDHVHVPGKLTVKTCLMCHDKSKHGNGSVDLIHFKTGQSFSGSLTEFCLTCHGDVSPKDLNCTECHATHGSPLDGLLKSKNREKPH